MGSSKNRWSGVKKVVSCATATALALCLTPAAAFAEDMTSTAYALPKSNDAISNFTHDGYKYISVGVEGNMSNNSTNRIAPAYQTGYEIMGLNYISAYSGAQSIFTGSHSPAYGQESSDIGTINKTYMTGDVGSLGTYSAPLAIMGTSINENPDEYIWNYCCWANGAKNVTDDMMVTDQGNGGVAAISVTVDGKTYTNFPRQVYYETDIIQADSAETNWNPTVASSDDVIKWGEWVEIEKKRTGHSNYNPTYLTLPSASTSKGSAYDIIDNFYAIANAVDTKVVQQSLSNGVYAKRTRYGGNSATGTTDMVSKMEDIYMAPEYFTLSKLAAGTEKAVTAVLIGYDPQNGNYACRKYNAPADPGTAAYGGRVANYLSPISMGIAEKLGAEAEQQTVYDSTNESAYVAWYSPKQIAETCDAVFVCDAYSANTIASYLAKAQDGKPYAVYAPQIGRTSDKTQVEDRTQYLAKAISDSKSDCGFCYSYPTTMFGSFYAQGAENGMLGLITSAYTYPQIFNDEGVKLADLFAYWAKYVWHIQSDKVADVVASVTTGMHLSSGEEIGSVSANWEENANQLIQKANLYYLSNYAEIDKASPQLKTHDLNALIARTNASTAAMYEEMNATKTDLASTKTSLSSAQESLAATQTALVTTQTELASATEQIASLTAELSAAKAANTTVTINKATVKASDIPDTATTVILGTKVATIKANAFKGKNVTTVFAMTKKLSKAKVKNCFKGSKVTTVQVPGSKYSAYKKIFKKANCGKKVSVG